MITSAFQALSSGLDIPQTTIQTITDFDRFNNIFTGLQVSAMQVSGGPFSGAFRAVFTRDLSVFRMSTSQSLFFRISGAGQYLIVPVTSQNADCIWSGFRFRPGTLLIARADRKIHLLTRADTVISGMQISATSLRQLVGQTLEPATVGGQLKTPARVCASQRFAALVRSLEDLLDTDLRQSVTAPGYVESDRRTGCVRQLAEAIQYSVPHQRSPNSADLRRSQLFRSTYRLLNRCLEVPITAEELCSRTNQSASILRRAFVSNVGVAPLAWMRLMRMHAVRQVLIQRRESGELNRTVVEVAHQFGFRRLGAFANDYTSLFGERPSWTLGVRGENRSIARSSRRLQKSPQVPFMPSPVEPVFPGHETLSATQDSAWDQSSSAMPRLIDLSAL